MFYKANSWTEIFNILSEIG